VTAGFANSTEICTDSLDTLNLLLWLHMYNITKTLTGKNSRYFYFLYVWSSILKSAKYTLYISCRSGQHLKCIIPACHMKQLNWRINDGTCISPPIEIDSHFTHACISSLELEQETMLANNNTEEVKKCIWHKSCKKSCSSPSLKSTEGIISSQHGYFLGEYDLNLAI